MSILTIGEITVRRAVESDAAEIADVHLDSWREAYRNLLPRECFAQLPLSIRERINMWKQASTMDGRAVFVAESAEGIVGFAFFLPALRARMTHHGEVAAIYLLDRFKGKGVGAALLNMGMAQFLEWGFSKAHCWVLQNNPAIDFYERAGAVFNGMEKDEEIAGQRVKELCYEWKSLESFKSIGERR